MDYKDADIDVKWEQLATRLSKQINKKPDLKSVLFLIGVNELGKGPISFTKEEKQDLIHIGNCRILSYSDHYLLKGLDQDGWPDWELIKAIPLLSEFEQEKYIKWHVIEYFTSEQNI